MYRSMRPGTRLVGATLTITDSDSIRLQVSCPVVEGGGSPRTTADGRSHAVAGYRPGVPCSSPGSVRSADEQYGYLVVVSGVVGDPVFPVSPLGWAFTT